MCLTANVLVSSVVAMQATRNMWESGRISTAVSNVPREPVTISEIAAKMFEESRGRPSEAGRLIGKFQTISNHILSVPAPQNVNFYDDALTDRIRNISIKDYSLITPFVFAAVVVTGITVCFYVYDCIKRHCEGEEYDLRILKRYPDYWKEIKQERRKNPDFIQKALKINNSLQSDLDFIRDALEQKVLRWREVNEKDQDRLLSIPGFLLNAFNTFMDKTDINPKIVSTLGKEPFQEDLIIRALQKHFIDLKQVHRKLLLNSDFGNKCVREIRDIDFWELINFVYPHDKIIKDLWFCSAKYRNEPRFIRLALNRGIINWNDIDNKLKTKQFVLDCIYECPRDSYEIPPEFIRDDSNVAYAAYCKYKLNWSDLPSGLRQSEEFLTQVFEARARLPQWNEIIPPVKNKFNVVCAALRAKIIQPKDIPLHIQTERDSAYRLFKDNLIGWNDLEPQFREDIDFICEAFKQRKIIWADVPARFKQDGTCVSRLIECMPYYVSGGDAKAIEADIQGMLHYPDVVIAAYQRNILRWVDIPGPLKNNKAVISVVLNDRWKLDENMRLRIVKSIIKRFVNDKGVILAAIKRCFILKEDWQILYKSFKKDKQFIAEMMKYLSISKEDIESSDDEKNVDIAPGEDPPPPPYIPPPEYTDLPRPSAPPLDPPPFVLPANSQPSAPLLEKM